MFVRWKCAFMSGSFRLNSAGLGLLSLLAFILLPGAILVAQTEAKATQQQEDQSATRAERLDQIQEAIRRMEQQLPQLSEEQLEGRLQEALQGLELRLQTPQDRFVLGITLSVQESADDEGLKVFVDEVEPESAAAKAGLQKGDQIVEVNGEPLRDPAQLVEAVQQTQGIEPLRIQIMRGDETMELSATPTLQPADEAGVQQFQWRPFRDADGDDPILIPNLRRLEGMLMPEKLSEVEADIEKLRAEVNELRQQMKDMSAELKALREALKNRDSDGTLQD